MPNHEPRMDVKVALNGAKVVLNSAERIVIMAMCQCGDKKCAFTTTLYNPEWTMIPNGS